jgi:hypothetical protein
MSTRVELHSAFCVSRVLWQSVFDSSGSRRTIACARTQAALSDSISGSPLRAPVSLQSCVLTSCWQRLSHYTPLPPSCTISGGSKSAIIFTFTEAHTSLSLFLQACLCCTPTKHWAAAQAKVCIMSQSLNICCAAAELSSLQAAVFEPHIRG